MVERLIFGRKDWGSKAPAVVLKLGQFRSPHFAGVFRKTLKAVGLFCLVSMSGEVKDPTQVNRKKLLWTQCSSQEHVISLVILISKLTISPSLAASSCKGSISSSNKHTM